MASEKIRGHLDLLILAVVANGPRHGYAIIADLGEESGQVFDLPEGTVYPALHRLERNGLLESSWAEGSTRRRRIYSLTDLGRSGLVQERAEWSSFASGMQSILDWSECLQMI